jgi:hypothetical protein
MPPAFGKTGNAASPRQRSADVRPETAAICIAYEQRGEFSAAIELRRLFPGIADNAQARECVRTIASWKPLPKPLRPAGLRAGNTN